MDSLAEILDQIIVEPSPEAMQPDERKVRAVVIAALFSSKQKQCADPTTTAKYYLESTSQIPFSLLVLAVRGLIRAHCYPSVPEVADIWKAARHLAGMNRNQYHAGRYIPPPTMWPPAGKRHAINANEFERLPDVSVALLADPKRAAAYLGAGV